MPMQKAILSNPRNLVNLDQNASNYHEQTRLFALDFQQRVIAEAESKHSQSIAAVQQDKSMLVYGIRP
eukprot:6065373-Amphidinium_carterae.1